MSGAAFVFFFQILALIGCVLTVIKLYRTRLHRRYRMFFILFLFLIPDTIWPLLIDNSSLRYEFFWLITEPITWLLYVVSVLELYRLVLEKHQGLYSLGRWILYIAVPTSVLVSIAFTAIPSLSRPTIREQSRLLSYYLAAERGVCCSLTLFILLILLFLSRYPLRLSRNVLVHTGLYSLYFLSVTLGTVLHSLLGMKLWLQVNLFGTGVSSLCTIAWFFLLTSRGEEAHANLPLYPNAYEERALRQLEGLNATLLRSPKGN
jgi:hypothetical protein